MLDVRYIQRVRGPACRANRCKAERRNDVPKQAVVLVYALRILHASVEARDIVLREPDNGLEVYENIKYESEPSVRRLEVLMPRAGLVYLDDYETSGKRCGAEDMEEEVCESAGAFLFGRVRGLEDEGCLNGEEEAGLRCINDTVAVRGILGWCLGLRS